MNQRDLIELFSVGGLGIIGLAISMALNAITIAAGVYLGLWAYGVTP
jgi:hypothetical protein